MTACIYIRIIRLRWEDLCGARLLNLFRAFNDFSSNLAHKTIFYPVTEKKKHILCTFVVDINRRNEQLFVSARFSSLNVTDASLHLEASKVFFCVLNCGNRQWHLYWTLLFPLDWYVKYIQVFWSHAWALWLLEVRLCLPVFHVSEILAGLIWSTRFEMALPWARNERKVKGCYC